MGEGGVHLIVGDKMLACLLACLLTYSKGLVGVKCLRDGPKVHADLQCPHCQKEFEVEIESGRESIACRTRTIFLLGGGIVD